ncbi:IS3 family transposase [Brevibacillus laterosporus]|uniref:IS3 family transposase n=1 Tax=Brevibacillus laterosporus TaxID=1465 RepID=UPI00196982EE|nr:IS3 family transposase [Brevibacillus laterosporus]
MDKRGKSRSGDHPFIGRPQIFYCGKERNYLKAQVEYLKKRNPNLHLAIWKVNRFLIINELRKKYPLTWLVEIARMITTNGLVQIQTGAESNSDPPSSSILRISKNVIALRKKGWNVNHKRVYRLMKESVLKGRHSHKGN